MYQARPLDGLARTPTPCVVPPTLSSPPTFSPPLPPHLPSLSPVHPSAGSAYGSVAFYNGGISTSPADAHQRAAAALSAVSAAQHISFEAVEERLRAEQKVQRALLCGVEQQRRRALVLLGAVARLQADEADARVGVAWSEARLRRSLWVRSLARPPRRSRSAAAGDPSGRRRSRSAVSSTSTDGGLARYGVRTHAVTPLHESVGVEALPPSYHHSEAEAASSPPRPLPSAPSAEVCAQELMLASREERVARAALVQAERLGFDFVVSRSKGERRKFRSEKKAYESYSRRIGHFHAEPEGSEVRPTIHDGLRVDTSAVSSRLHRTAIGHNKRNVTAAAEEPPRKKFAGTAAAAAAAATQQARRAAEEEAGSEHRRRAARVLESMTVDAAAEAAAAAAAEAAAESLPLRSESAAPLPLWPPPTPSASIVAAVDAALLAPAGLPPQASSVLLAAQPPSKHISPPRGPGADGGYRATRVSFADDAAAPAARSASQPAPSTASRSLLRRAAPPPSAAVPVHAVPSARHRSGSVLSSLLESTASTGFVSRYAGPPVPVPARSHSAAEPLLSLPLPLPLPCRSATSEPVEAAAAAAAAASAVASAAADAAAAASAAGPPPPASSRAASASVSAVLRDEEIAGWAEVRGVEGGCVDCAVNLSLRRSSGKAVHELLERAARSGLRELLLIGGTLAGSAACLKLAEAPEFRRHGVLLYAAVGVHPLEAHSWTATTQAELTLLLSHPLCVAVGETGLDFHAKPYSRPPARGLQRWVFARHIELARRSGKPLFLHERGAGAAEGVLSALDAEQFPWSACVLHCFSNGVHVLERILARGMRVAVSGHAATRRHDAGVTLRHALKRHAARSPAHRAALLGQMMVETDSPHLVPDAVHGALRAKQRGAAGDEDGAGEEAHGKPAKLCNEPAYLPAVLRAVADLVDATPAEVAASTAAVARSFFGFRSADDAHARDYLMTQADAVGMVSGEVKEGGGGMPPPAAPSSSCSSSSGDGAAAAATLAPRRPPAVCPAWSQPVHEMCVLEVSRENAGRRQRLREEWAAEEAAAAAAAAAAGGQEEAEAASLS
eukprot:Rhum_TRINITY_DN14774_c9_g1::Rhum_TRINITY_DN14774_c9_g1_i1::g.116278::m.116278